jgi:hypothetical protein
MVTTLMSGSAIISEFLKSEDIKKELKEIKDSKEKEEEITKEFNKSMKKLSFLL